ncbi:MAG: Rnase Y domain-containing protein, partial [Clostridia bacterium]
MTVTVWVAIIIAVVSAAVTGFGCFYAGIAFRKKIAEKAIKSAEVEAKRIVDDAQKSGETKKKEYLLEAKEEALRIKNDAEKEIKERRVDLQRIEKRVVQKEENLDKKNDALDAKDENLNKKLKEVETVKLETEKARQEQLDVLQKLAQMSCEDAKTILLERVEEETRHEMAMKLAEIENEYKDTADEKAKNIITLAIQRCAADSVAEATVSVVDLPNDEMKGRIIGREGRNIRSIETLTGVDLIIDDTPEAITISTFDPIRRE